MKHTAHCLIIALLFFVVQHMEAVAYLDKPVSLSSDKSTLKAVLKLLSDQSGCTFSYNPLLLPDNQPITPIGISNIKLSSALRKLLPEGFTFSINEKYIILKKQTKKKRVEVPTQKTDSKIDKDLKKVALVVPIIDESTIYSSNYSRVKDSMVLIVPTAPVGISVGISPVEKTSKSDIYQSDIDSTKIRRMKTEYFLRKNLHFQVGVSSSSPLSSVLFQAGAFGFYGIFSLSTDYNNSYRMGYGIGYNYEFQNNMGLNVNAERIILFAGQSYDLGVRATITRFDPLFTYSISRDFKLFIGPSIDSSESSYINANTDLGKSFTVGILIGIKIDILSFLLAKK